jgi:hypothetical protein
LHWATRSKAQRRARNWWAGKTIFTAYTASSHF